MTLPIQGKGGFVSNLKDNVGAALNSTRIGARTQYESIDPLTQMNVTRDRPSKKTTIGRAHNFSTGEKVQDEPKMRLAFR
jgi:hypothetical protein